MTDQMWIVIPNWDGPTGFQHYKDRTPKWIKTYVELMSDDAYLGLSGHRRAILHGLWLEYASSRRRLRVDTVSLSRRLALRVTTQDLKSLNQAGFIQFSASAPLAEPEQNRSLEKRREEKNPPTPLDRGAGRRTPEERREQKRAAKPLPYLAGAQAIWNTHTNSTDAERTTAVRVWLEGFTDNQTLIDAHLAALVAGSRARVSPALLSESEAA